MNPSSKKFFALVVGLAIATLGFAEPTKFQKAQFKKGDVDKNGSLNESEFVAVKLVGAKKTADKNNKEFAPGKVTTRQKKIFARTDSDGNGKISDTEFYSTFPGKKK